MLVGRRALYKSAAAFAATGVLPASASAQPRDDIAALVRALVPDLERYVTTGMAAFDVPGTAVGVVVGDRLGRHEDRVPDRLDDKGFSRG